MEHESQSKLHYGWSMEMRALEWLTDPERAPGEAASRVCIARNYRCRGGEIDLVLEERRQPGFLAAPELVFVEVRARTRGSSWQTGIESLGAGKRRRLARAIRHFLAFGYRGRARTLRIDALTWDGRAWEHFRDLRLDV